MQKQITVPEIGTVLITKKTNSTKIKLRVHPVKGVLVSIPYAAKFSDAESFVYKNIDWLKSVLTKQQQSKSVFSPESIFITRNFEVKFILHDKQSFNAKVDNNNIYFFYNPQNADFNDKRIQDFIKNFILKVLKLEGEVFLKKRIVELSQKSNINFAGIKIGTASTRWGSCNTRNEIILSCRLLLLPDELIDYVILHELCHVVYKNHGTEFHKLLDKLVYGKSKDLNKSLKKYSIEIKPGNYKYTN